MTVVPSHASSVERQAGSTALTTLLRDVGGPGIQVFPFRGAGWLDPEPLRGLEVR